MTIEEFLNKAGFSGKYVLEENTKKQLSSIDDREFVRRAGLFAPWEKDLYAIVDEGPTIAATLKTETVCGGRLYCIYLAQ